MMQFPRIEILRAELAFLQLHNIPKYYLTVMQDEAQILYETFADDVLYRKELASVCEFQELQMAFNNSCSFRHLFRNFCQLNYTANFEAYLVNYVLYNYQVDLHDFRYLQNNYAFDYYTRYLQFSGTQLDRMLSYGILAVLALILDVTYLYDENSVLKLKDMQILPLSEKNEVKRVLQDESLQFEEQYAKKIYELRYEYSDIKQSVATKRKPSTSAYDPTASATESSSPQLFGQRYRDERNMLTLEQQEKEILRLNGLIVDLKQELEYQRNYASADAAALEARLKDAYAEVTHQTAVISALERQAYKPEYLQVACAENEISYLKEEISRLQDVIQQLSNENKQLQTSQSSAQKEALLQENTNLYQHVQLLQTEANASKDAFSEFKRLAQEKLLGLDSLIYRYNAIIEQLQARPKPKEISEVAQFVINDLESQILSLKDQFAKLKTLYQESKLQVAVQQEYNLTAETRVKQLSAQLEEVKTVNYQLLLDLSKYDQK